MSSKSSKIKGSKDAESLTDVKSSTPQSTDVGETESGKKNSEVKSSAKKGSQKKTSKKSLYVTPVSHKDLRELAEGNELGYAKEKAECFSNLNVMCNRCKNFYSYTDNRPYIMKCGTSICYKCASLEFICKDCESVEEENLPTNVINKDLHQNNYLILKAMKTLDYFTDSDKTIINKKISTRRIDLQKLDDQYNEVLSNKFSINKYESDLLATCEAHFNMMTSCIYELKLLRSSIESFNSGTKLNDFKEINEKNEKFQLYLREVDSSFFYSFTKFKTSRNFQTIVKLSDFKFSNRYMGLHSWHIRFYSYSKKGKYHRVYFAGPFLLLKMDSEFIGTTNGSILIFDEESFKCQTTIKGIFFRISTARVLINVPIRFGESSIGKQIVSFCSNDQTPSFINGQLQVGTKDIVIKARLNGNVKYWNDIDELIYKAPIKKMVSISQIEDFELTLTIHLVDSDTPAYIIGSAMEYLSELQIGDYEIISFGVACKVRIE